jgi:hypothetical protein
MHRILAGLAAGAAGTTALNLVTYLDMLARARPASSTPEETVRVLERRTGLGLAADGPDTDAAGNRRSALGALLGIASGLGVGAVYGAVRPALGRLPLPLLGVAAGLAANVATTGRWPRPASPTRGSGRRGPGCPTSCRTWPTGSPPPRCGS